jgi:hypothetical protein
MWLLVLSDWRFYTSIPASNTITEALRRQFSQEAVLPRRDVAECA